LTAPVAALDGSLALDRRPDLRGRHRLRAA
jgi:hypothetical protein